MTAIEKLPEITYWVCGGTGLNIADAITAHTNSPYNKAARFIGLDASNANIPTTKFAVERIKLPDDPEQVAKGSGKIQKTNYEAAQPFVDQALTHHKPSLYNVIVCNLAGGSGSMIALLVFRWLKGKGHVAPCIFIGEKGDTVAFTNSLNTMNWFSNQVSPDVLGVPVPYIEMWNDPQLTRGEMNKEVVKKADLLSLFMTEKNGEMDFSDFQNLMEYSKYNLAPALSRITFADQRIAEVEGELKDKPPVAVASLFTEKDKIVARFQGAGVRSTGIFPDNDDRPKHVTELHMMLDHGDALRDLEKQRKELEDVKTTSNNRFTTQKPLATAKAADGNGVSF